MVKTKTNEKNFHELITGNHRKINYIFLGVGLLIFVMNITAFLSFVKTMEYSYFFFNMSIFSAMFIVLIAVYGIYESK